MSYNVTNVDAKVLDAWMTPEDVVQLANRTDDLPESHFLEAMLPVATKALERGEDCAKCSVTCNVGARFCSGCGAKFAERLADQPVRIPLESFWWHGEGSGHSYDFLKDVVCPKIHGRVEAIFTWEGGDSFGVIVKDGTVTECRVEQKLVREKTKRGGVSGG